MASVLLLACAREAVCDGVVATYGSLFNDRVEITVPGYRGGTNKLPDFPLLVRLSEGSPDGFTYERVDARGQDIRFVFVEGTVSNAVPYEVDTWNTNGVSTLWVRLPYLNSNANNRLLMYWAPDDPTALPTNEARTVWNGYAGVWHMNGADESTTNVIASTVGKKASAQTGVVGYALGTRVSDANGPILAIPAGTPVDAVTDGAYAISAWLKVNSFAAKPWFYSSRTTQTDDSFGAELIKPDASGLSLKLHADKDTADGSGTKRFASGEWVHLAVVHDGANDEHHVYLNGAKFYNPKNARVDKPGAGGFAFGGLVGESAAGTLNGDLDEIRILPAAQVQSWFTNEYAQVTAAGYIAFTNFYSTGTPVYSKKKEDAGDDPSPGVSGDVSVEDYAGTATFVPAQVAEGVVLTNFVSMIKIWKGEPVGFDPKALPFGSEDIRFFDDQGNVLPYEIDTWDENSESFFWVRVPRLTASTRIIMCWGLRSGKTLPPYLPKTVWSDYAGVWHLSDASDATTNAAAGVFGSSAETIRYGLVGAAAGTTVSGSRGAILDIAANEALETLTNAPFTVSGWAMLNGKNVAHGALFSRATASDPAWGAQFCGGTSGNSGKLELQTGSSFVQADTSEIDWSDWVRFECVYASDRLTLYLNGGTAVDSPQARTIVNGIAGKLSLGGFASGDYTLNGFLDEVRIRPGGQTAAERAAECAQCTNESFYTRMPATWDESAILQNRWRVVPTLSKTEWNEGDEPATYTLGEPWYGVSGVSFQDRTTGEAFAEMPTVAGDYRAVFFCPQNGRYSALSYTIDFRVRIYRPTHDLGDGNDRILILSGDQSVEEGKVYVQAYSDTAKMPGRPYWVHDEDTGYDYTSTSDFYNFCGGLRHTYYSRGYGYARTRLWDLIDVRYGNTYNNADAVLERTGDWEEWDTGLAEDMNYLPWNPEGGRLVEDTGFPAEGWHEYAAQAVMCNTLKASINSGLYTNGIGTIYFDCVNSHVDDATNGFYRLVVEMATNAVDRATGLPSGLPTDEAIERTYSAYDAEGHPITVVEDSYYFADWKPLTMTVNLVKDGVVDTNSWTTGELSLEITAGGSYRNLYRIHVPVDYAGAARFRIRRTAVNPDYSISFDYHSLVLVDNVICSTPTARIRVEPHGFYDTSKVKRETAGYEGAFLPAYPSVSDAEIYARARVASASGSSAGEMLSSVLMHYRWRYLNQQDTQWLTADLNPKTLTSLSPLHWPVLSGDLEYWYEVNQASAFYQYTDYSGLNVGLPGYSEEVLSVTNRAATYETEGRDWFTRIRAGKSTCGSIKLRVRRGASAAVETVDMFVERDRIWRGCLQATNAIPDGILFRFEVRDRQDDTLADFQFNTNLWYLADEPQKLPFSGSAVVGTTNDWGCVPCDGATGHLLFQLDETTRALTVAHADWQDFNAWNDAHRSYFTGTSVDDASKSGTSANRREYNCLTSQWEDDCATNQYWIERFMPSTISGYEFFVPFTSARTPNGFSAGYGQWVPSAYAITNKVNDHYQQALQMEGQGHGFVQMVEPAELPRGLESVKFSARIAQTVSPDDFAYYKGSRDDPALYLDDYTFLTRVAFDLNANSNFTGNASLSLAAFYQPGESCYEARWEQIDGYIADGSGTVLGPAPRGQRLALYRWRYEGQQWQATELHAATNSGSVFSWSQSVSPQAIPQAHSITNNGLMPFCLGAYNNEDAGYTVVIAAIHIPGGSSAVQNRKGNTAVESINKLQQEKGWLYVVYRDTDARRLTSGTYGVLAANCEGEFVRPQYHEGLVSWKNQSQTRVLATTCHPDAFTYYAATADFYNYYSAKECVEDILENRWRLPDCRMESFCDTSYDPYNGFRASVVTQTVDIYTAPLGTTSWQEDYHPVASRTLTGFGKPGEDKDIVVNFWSADDFSVRLRAGGEYRKGVCTDVVVDNIRISQWRGNDWLGNDEQGGLTNFVYTSGWMTDGALLLSPRRTPDDYPCSLRAPLCDGGGSTRNRRGLGIGSFQIWYRNAQPNARLLFQVATNGVSELNLLDYTRDPGTDGYHWTTVTNVDFSVMTEDERASGVFVCSPGLHGVVGTMRVIVDPTLRAEVKDGIDPGLFGSVEITQALFRDEPPLDKGSWWGFNIRTIGDLSDTERRMYLPDNPLRSANPTLDEIGMSLALNNSITEDCDPEEVGKEPNPFRAHMPFLQTPTFTSNIVGEISFRARKYNLQKGSQNAEVTLYGTQSASIDSLNDWDWKYLDTISITNTTFETYRRKIDTGNGGYRAFRLAVTGVEGVTWSGPKPVSGEPVRVLIDEVLVSEAIRARLAFRNVGAFRSYLSKTTYVPNVPSAAEQPICGEGWGVQAEVYPAMLGEEIDSSVKTKVRLHYFKGASPWGFSNWKDQATSAWLTEATDTNNFFRSSAVDSPAAVIPMSQSSDVVQYMLEVVYGVINTESGATSLATNWLESVDWPTPSWYHPVDYNELYGYGQADGFAAFSLIDPIAPGWAWINEINIFGSYDASLLNSDRKKQFVEIAKPVEYDLEGWILRMLAAKSLSSASSGLITNNVAIFGRNVPSQKTSPSACNMSFLVVGNPSTDLSREKGEYDGAWNFTSLDYSTFLSGGELGSWSPVAIQLVRPSGVIEHEVVILGTNLCNYAAPAVAWQYDSTNLLRIVQSADVASRSFVLPDDRHATTDSVGVFGSRGESDAWWNDSMELTPGRINRNQTIDPDHPTPGGELIMVFAGVDTTFGRILQTVGAGTNTTELQTVALKRGNEGGLDIRYSVAPWCELGTVDETEGGVRRTPHVVTNAVRQYTVNVAKGATQNVTVLASATVDSRLREYGLDGNNRYTPAVLHWLERHIDAYGNEFYGWRGGTTNDTIHAAKFVSLSGTVTNDMTLTQMYWLDIDPTMDEMYFRAGMARPPSLEVVKVPTYDPEHDVQAQTNLRVGVYMAISNGNGRAQETLGRTVWAPYVLRGLGEDELSWNYDPNESSANAWTSVTFKATGFMNNGDTRESDPEAWIPLRYFIFKEDSFDSNFESEIDLADPYSTRSPAYSHGWYRWTVDHGWKPPVYFSWNLDTRLQPITAEVLAPTNRLSVLP